MGVLELYLGPSVRHVIVDMESNSILDILDQNTVTSLTLNGHFKRMWNGSTVYGGEIDDIILTWMSVLND